MTGLTDDLLLQVFDLDDLVLQVVYDARLGFHLLGGLHLGGLQFQ